MVEKSHSSEAVARLQTLQPKFHLRVAGFFILCMVFLGILSGYTKDVVYKTFYGGVDALGAVALIVQYRRERRIVHNRLSAVGVVTEYRIPLRGKSRFLNLLVSKFSPEVPRIKYSFVAFDQKTYTGETGWGAAGLYEGAQVTVLYKPEDPAVNHPVTSFIFYSFH